VLLKKYIPRYFTLLTQGIGAVALAVMKRRQQRHNIGLRQILSCCSLRLKFLFISLIIHVEQAVISNGVTLQRETLQTVCLSTNENNTTTQQVRRPVERNARDPTTPRCAYDSTTVVPPPTAPIANQKSLNWQQSVVLPTRCMGHPLPLHASDVAGGLFSVQFYTKAAVLN